MSLVDDVLAEHTQGENYEPQYSPEHGRIVLTRLCVICEEPWPCDPVLLAIQLRAAEQVVEAARTAEQCALTLHRL